MPKINRYMQPARMPQNLQAFDIPYELLTTPLLAKEAAYENVEAGLDELETKNVQGWEGLDAEEAARANAQIAGIKDDLVKKYSGDLSKAEGALSSAKRMINRRFSPTGDWGTINTNYAGLSKRMVEIENMKGWSREEKDILKAMTADDYESYMKGAKTSGDGVTNYNQFSAMSIQDHMDINGKILELTKEIPVHVLGAKGVRRSTAQDDVGEGYLISTEQGGKVLSSEEIIARLGPSIATDESLQSFARFKGEMQAFAMGKNDPNWLDKLKVESEIDQEVIRVLGDVASEDDATKEEIKDFQEALIENGANIKADGILGKNTKDAYTLVLNALEAPETEQAWANQWAKDRLGLGMNAAAALKYQDDGYWKISAKVDDNYKSAGDRVAKAAYNITNLFTETPGMSLGEIGLEKMAITTEETRAIANQYGDTASKTMLTILANAGLSSNPNMGVNELFSLIQQQIIADPDRMKAAFGTSDENSLSTIREYRDLKENIEAYRANNANATFFENIIIDLEKQAGFDLDENLSWDLSLDTRGFSLNLNELQKDIKKAIRRGDSYHEFIENQEQVFPSIRINKLGDKNYMNVKTFPTKKEVELADNIFNIFLDNKKKYKEKVLDNQDEVQLGSKTLNNLGGPLGRDFENEFKESLRGNTTIIANGKHTTFNAFLKDTKVNDTDYQIKFSGVSGGQPTFLFYGDAMNQNRGSGSKNMEGVGALIQIPSSTSALQNIALQSAIASLDKETIPSPAQRRQQWDYNNTVYGQMLLGTDFLTNEIDRMSINEEKVIYLPGQESELVIKREERSGLLSARTRNLNTGETFHLVNSAKTAQSLDDNGFTTDFTFDHAEAIAAEYAKSTLSQQGGAYQGLAEENLDLKVIELIKAQNR